MSVAYDQMAALAAHLKSTITVANGYAFDVAVSVGEIVGSKASLPRLILTPAQDDLPRSNDNPGDPSRIEAFCKVQRWERSCWLEGLVAGSGDWVRSLDQALDATRKALTTYPHPLLVGGVAFEKPEPGSPDAVAAFRCLLTLVYCANYAKPL